MKIKTIDSVVVDQILENIEMSTGVSKTSQEILGVFQDEQGMTLVATKWFTTIDLEEEDPLYKKMVDQLDKFVPDWREFDLLMEDGSILRDGEQLADPLDPEVIRNIADQVEKCLDLAESSNGQGNNLTVEVFLDAARGHLSRPCDLTGGEAG